MQAMTGGFLQLWICKSLICLFQKPHPRGCSQGCLPGASALPAPGAGMAAGVGLILCTGTTGILLSLIQPLPVQLLDTVQPPGFTLTGRKTTYLGSFPLCWLGQGTPRAGSFYSSPFNTGKWTYWIFMECRVCAMCWIQLRDFLTVTLGLSTLMVVSPSLLLPIRRVTPTQCVLHLWIQSTLDRKYMKKNSRNFQKAKL